MKFNKMAVCLGMATVVMAGNAMAKSVTDSTKVTFTGTITEAPCSLDTGSDKQEVDMGHIAAHLLKNKGKATSKPFRFQLTDCEISTLKNVTVTFNGTADNRDSALLALGSGDATGAGIAITEADGSLITLGQASHPRTLQDGDNTLSFAAYLQGDGASAVTPGSFSAVSDVTFTYQ